MLNIVGWINDLHGLDFDLLMADFQAVKQGASFKMMETSIGPVLVLYTGQGTDEELLAAFEAAWQEGP